MINTEFQVTDSDEIKYNLKDLISQYQTATVNTFGNNHNADYKISQQKQLAEVEEAINNLISRIECNYK